MRNVDYLIVGQGLAGTLIGHFLEKQNASFLFINEDKPYSSSKLAAGIINPITGRRFVKSWMFDDLWPVAMETYKEFSEKFKTPFYYANNVKRALFSQKEENDWDGRTLDDQYVPYMKENIEKDDIDQAFEEPFSWGEITNSGRLEMPKLVKAYKDFLKQNNLYVSGKFDYSILQVENDKVVYNDIEAKHIIFCEGISTMDNPFFSWLPFVPSKGDVLFVKIDKVNIDKIIKHKVFVVPQGNDIYWIGSTYDWDYEDENPNEIFGKKIEEKLKAILKVPFEVVDHRAAIRPTVKDRRPFIGQHPKHSNVSIFNGLGTKGASLGPYWAKYFVEKLLDGTPLDSQIDIKRFIL